MAPRVSLSLKDKCAILKELQDSGLSKTNIARKYSIPKTTLSTILKNRDKILQSVNDGSVPGRKRVRNAKFQELEIALTEWLRMMRGKNIPIDGNILTEKANDFALRMDIDDFKGSSGWLQKFKARHGLSFCKLSGESASVDLSEADGWKEKRLKEILKNYSKNDIFNADETGLMFQQLPDRTLTFRKEKCNGGKKAKSRLTLLVCANMSGTEKLPLLVIGKYKKPRCFKGIKNLPTTYRANLKSWMNSTIFTEWIKDLDRQMAFKNRKIILVVDNCTAHVQVENLKAVTLEFLPPNLTSVIQPMDQGIIQNLKVIYRRSLLKRIILNMENDKDYVIDVLGAIHLACFAWNAVTAETIAHCFKHAGFVASDPVEERAAPAENGEAEDEALFQSLVCKRKDISGTFKDFVNVDSDIACIEETTEECIIAAAVQQARTEDTEQNASDDSDDDSEREPKPSTRDVLKATEVIRRYFEEEENPETVLAFLTSVENQVIKNSKFVQPKITGFFLPK